MRAATSGTVTSALKPSEGGSPKVATLDLPRRRGLAGRRSMSACYGLSPDSDVPPPLAELLPLPLSPLPIHGSIPGTACDESRNVRALAAVGGRSRFVSLRIFLPGVVTSGAEAAAAAGSSVPSPGSTATDVSPD